MAVLDGCKPPRLHPVIFFDVKRLDTVRLLSATFGLGLQALLQRNVPRMSLAYSLADSLIQRGALLDGFEATARRRLL